MAGHRQRAEGKPVHADSAGPAPGQGLRLAGFFDGANAVLVGRTSAPDKDSLTQHEAVLDALGTLGVPIIADVECGHVPPYLPIVNGAHGRVTYTSTRHELTQTLE